MPDPRISVLHTITRLIVGGAQENTLYTAEMLNKDIFRVDVITGIQTGIEGSLLEEARSRNINLICMPEMVREINLVKDIIAFIKLRSFIRTNNYSIIHSHSSKAGIITRIAASIEKTPVIVHTVHGWGFHDYMHPVKKWIYIILEKICAGVSDALIFVSDQDIKTALKFKIGNPEKYHLIRSAIPLNEFNPEHCSRKEIRSQLCIPDEALVIGNIGRFSDQKDPITWIQAAAQLAKKYPQCWFLLVGDGPLREETENLASQLGIDEKTIFTGIRRDVARMFCAVDIFVITSRWEGLPRVIPQAMSMRVPVVANRVSGIADVVDHGVTGFLVEPGNFDELVQVCSKLVENPDLRISMGLKASEAVKTEFSLEIMIAQIADLYMELIKKDRYTGPDLKKF